MGDQRGINVRSVDRGDGLRGRTRSSLLGAIVVLLFANAVALAAHDGDKSSSSTSALTTAPPTTGAVDSIAAQALAEGRSRTPVSAAPAPASKSQAAQAAGTSPSTTSTSSPASTPNRGGYTYQVTVEPTCARVGEVMRVTVRVYLTVTVGIIAVFADDDTHNTVYGTWAGEDGVVVHQWVTPPVPGDGKVYTGATEPGGRNSNTVVDFRVVGATDTC